MLKFLKKVISEIKKVSWPTFNELWRKTLVVFVFVFILMSFTYLVDIGLTHGIRFIGK